MPKTHGRKKGGALITDKMIEGMADEAEHGYNVDEILRKRQGGRPPIGSAAASVESVRLDPELKRDLLLRAAKEGVSLSELIRRALRKYVKAS
jgi:predicted HicB family RNase H-like nuclease